MLLLSVSWLDVAVFLAFLTFHLVASCFFLRAVYTAIRALPFLLVQLPCQLVKQRWLTPAELQLPFTRRTTVFQDVVIRCLRWGFKEMPSDVGRIFFCKGVAVPYLRFRMWRSGYPTPGRGGCPGWTEMEQGALRGLWISHDAAARPDLVLYYIHGGGFTMGSSYFYLEFLLTWCSILRSRGGFKNPAVFALEYTLVPDAVYPVQLQQTLRGYRYVLSRAGDPGLVAVGGDSAGAMLVLSLLLHLGAHSRSETPMFAALISPWTHLLLEENRNTPSDFLDSGRLQEFGLRYAGCEDPYQPSVSPGECRDATLWRDSVPRRGLGFYYGSEELFVPGIRELRGRLETLGARVVAREKEEVHCWPVAGMFLEMEEGRRRKGLVEMSADITEALLCE